MYGQEFGLSGIPQAVNKCPRVKIMFPFVFMWGRELPNTSKIAQGKTLKCCAPPHHHPSPSWRCLFNILNIIDLLCSSTSVASSDRLSSHSWAVSVRRDSERPPPSVQLSLLRVPKAH